MSNCKLCLADCAFKGKDMKKGNCKGYIPMTNADRLSAMSDEEKAKELTMLFYLVSQKTNAEHYILDWLQQPAKEDT